MLNRVITISREFGSGGRTIGKKVAEKLGVPCYDAQLIQKIDIFIIVPPESYRVDYLIAGLSVYMMKEVPEGKSQYGTLREFPC